jgi:hypothetical protein
MIDDIREIRRLSCERRDCFGASQGFKAIEYIFTENWQWALSAILIPLAGWVWKGRKATKRKSAATPAPKHVPSAPIPETPPDEDKKSAAARKSA